MVEFVHSGLSFENVSYSFLFALLLGGGCFLLFVGSADAIEEWEWKRLIRKQLPKQRSGKTYRARAARAAMTDAPVANPIEGSQDPRRWKGWRDVIVRSVKDETPDCRSFVLAPVDGDPFPSFRGGQYLTVRLSNPENGKNVTRCYSLSSGPEERHYRITVKRVPGGKMSNLLHDTVAPGDTLQIQAPKGKFHYDPTEATDSPLPLNLVAAGIGITPMMSMLFQSLNESSTREVNLFYQIRNATEAPFLTPIRELAAALQSTTGVRVHLWFSKPHPGDCRDGDSTGRLSARSILEQIGHERGEFLICGPDVFMNAFAEGLVERGVASKNVKFESFGGKSKSVGALAVPVIDDAADGTDELSVTHAVRFETSNQTGMFVSGMDGLLDVAEALDIAVDSSCRSGDCGSCVKRLLGGEVGYDEPPECDREDDEVVMCVAKPKTDVVLDA